MTKLRAYYPAIFLFLFGQLFFAFPELAALLLGGFLSLTALIYAWFQYKWQKVQRAQGVYNTETSSFESEVFNHGEPNIRNISVTIMNRYKTPDQM